jgi:hypothetical protein
LSLNFTQFSLNKLRYVMNVSDMKETADKEGGISLAADVVVHSNLHVLANQQADLYDKVCSDDFVFVSCKFCYCLPLSVVVFKDVEGSRQKESNRF